MRVSVISAALVAALVGFGSTVALVLAAAAAVGATPAQTASWLLAVSLAKAVGSAGLSWATRVPVVLAWSTPGAALIAASTGLTFAEAVGGFVVAGGLIAASGLIGPLGALIARIPDALAAAMLAGVLLPFALQVAPAAATLPTLVLPMIAVFLLVRLWNQGLAVLAALAAGVALALALGQAGPLHSGLGAPGLVFVWPEFTLAGVIGLGMPLFLVTMAGQNLPGFATLRAAGYDPPVRPALAATGGLSAAFALFGGHPINMAAITAAICLAEEVHPDRARRWVVGLAYGAIWCVLGLSSALVVAVIGALPSGLIAGIVGLALFGPLMGALGGAFTRPDQRFAAVVTLTVTASGVVVAGVGGAFWGLAAGLAVLVMEHWRR